MTRFEESVAAFCKEFGYEDVHARSQWTNIRGTRTTYWLGRTVGDIPWCVICDWFAERDTPIISVHYRPDSILNCVLIQHDDWSWLLERNET